jgi:Na+/H+ antiporter NhaD/arsenite permease-like protein
MTAHDDYPSEKPVILVLTGIVLIYGALVFTGTLQRWTAEPSATEAREEEAAAEPEGVGETHGGQEGHDNQMPAYAAVAPFIALLGAIAAFPLMPRMEHWWESNLHRFQVAVGLAALTLVYYLLIIPGGGLDRTLHVLDHAILGEYIPFIVLLFSLYTISGGIRIQGDLPAHPAVNTAFLATGGLLASFVGTTGAAMLLVRPLIETNRERRYVQHTVVFFIFIVCNCGGCLLPIGDPPLFLGYLQGVDFLWTTFHLWLPWLVTNAILLFVYFLWDTLFCYSRETRRDIRRDETQTRPLQIRGLWPNLFLLVGVILAVALLDPSKPVPRTNWRPPMYLRETVQLTMVALSLALGSRRIRRDNHFNYHAIVEVAALFVGIFICMQPAIEILHYRGPQLGIDSPMKYFWATGSLSSILDNAPTYLVFFQTAAAGFPDHAFHEIVSEPGPARQQLIAISLGAVFMGSMTYIGNGPNFMVRAIAEQMDVTMPSFFGYVVRYSVPVLIPIFLLITWLFL